MVNNKIRFDYLLVQKVKRNFVFVKTFWIFFSSVRFLMTQGANIVYDKPNVQHSPQPEKFQVSKSIALL